MDVEITSTDLVAICAALRIAERIAAEESMHREQRAIRQALHKLEDLNILHNYTLTGGK